MQDREGEAAARAQDGADGRDRAVQVVNVGQTEAARHQVELAAAKGSRHSYVGLDVIDAERLALLDLPGFPDQVPGDVNPRPGRAAPREFAGQAPVSARHVQDAAPSHRPQQVQQSQRDRVVGGVEAISVEIGDRIVPSQSHASTLVRVSAGLAA